MSDFKTATIIAGEHPTGDAATIMRELGAVCRRYNVVLQQAEMPPLGQVGMVLSRVTAEKDKEGRFIAHALAIVFSINPKTVEFSVCDPGAPVRKLGIG